MSVDRVISIVFREATMPEEPGKILEEPGVKAVTFMSTPISDENFLKILAFFSQFCGAVSLWGTKMIIPNDGEEPPQEVH